MRRRFLPAFVACVPLALFAPPARGQAFPLWATTGTSTGQAFGHSVAGLGDVNGDGVPDVVVGAPNASPGGLNGAGTVRVLSGGSALTLFVWNGAVAMEHFGSSVSGLGDVSGDGVPEFVVGSPGFPGGGRVRVYSGADGGVLHTLVVPSLTAGSLGSSVADAGDTDADGLPDVVAGNPPAGVSAFGSGNVYVFSGSSGSVLFGVSAFGSFGAAVSGAGDVDLDGHSDILVGAPTAGVSTVGNGFVFSGATASMLRFFQGISSGEHLGQSVAGPGDLSGDGVPDLVFGGPGGVPSPFGPGIVRAFSGAGSALLYLVAGESAGGLGASVASVGDVDGDGVAELAAGSFSPTVRQPGGVRVFSGASGTILWRVPETPASPSFGAIVGGPGDVSGDGIPDLLIGNPLADPGFLTDGGEVRAFSLVGFPTGTTPFGSGCPGSSGIVPLLQTSGGSPTVGNAFFKAVLSNAMGGTPAVLVAGFSSSTWLGAPLPLNLGFLGLPACALAVSADQFLTVFTSGAGPGTGTAFASIPIAPAPALAGTTSYYQWYVVDPGPLALPGAMSQALQVTVQ